ncbi:MAG: hypothetical protein QNK37_10500 [Acidobacteriota bacterium]|nr:hypothetical protein [Acidobacteriota bacterium]
MARKLIFAHAGEQYETPIAKLDRARVYGRVVKKAVDRDGQPCYFGALSADGAHIFGQGAFELGHVDTVGQWVERAELNAVDADGKPLEKLESSFKRTIELEETVSIDTYLDHTTRLVYQLDAPEALLQYDEDSGWEPCLPERFVDLLFSVFVRLRDDKGVNPEDLRLTQLRDLVDLDNLESSRRTIHYRTSEILRRRVWTKVTKGKTSVRKLITWRTNKHEDDHDFPPFVFCYTDYSPNRAQPLKRTVRGALNEAQADLFFESFQAKEIKKGWQ